MHFQYTASVVTRDELDSEDHIPVELRDSYLKEYHKFGQWKKEKGFETITEDMLLAYLTELSQVYAPTSLQTICSKLKTCLFKYDDVSTEMFSSLQRLVKVAKSGYTTRKAAVFTPEEIQLFVVNAPDDKYLVQKVMLILGVFCGLGKLALYHMQLSQVKDMHTHVVVKVVHGRSKTWKRFSIVSKPGQPYNPLAVVQKYLNLRKEQPDIPHLLLIVRNNKVTKTRIGLNAMGNSCREVAKYLNIENYNDYTGQSMYRSGVKAREGDSSGPSWVHTRR